MNLIIIRHAVAEEREDFAIKNKEDSLRPLTVKGKKRMEKMMGVIEDLVSEAHLIVTSPYTRAVQTAEIIGKSYPKVPVAVAAELVPHSPPQAFLKWLKGQKADLKNIIVVGHEPQLGLFLSYLLAFKNISFVDIKKSGAACIEISSWEEIEEGQPQLLWLIHPKMFLD